MTESGFYGHKRLAAALDCDSRTAKAILAVIADTEISPGVWRLSEEGFKAWRLRMIEEGRAKRNGNLPAKEETLGSKAAAPKWCAT